MLLDQPSLDRNLELKLTRVYVALAMSRNVAQLGLDAESLVKFLTVATDLLEDILDPKPTTQFNSSIEVPQNDLLM